METFQSCLTYLKRMKKKIKGVIASNVYDLSPLVKTLEIVADHFVNKHPRNIKPPKDDLSSIGDSAKKTIKKSKAKTEEVTEQTSNP